jgi:polar amino acid transport system permease protein
MSNFSQDQGNQGFGRRRKSGAPHNRTRRLTPRLRKRVALLDIVVIALLMLAGVYVVYRVGVGLDYRWDWGAVPQYLLRYDESRNSWVPNLLLQGVFNTIRLSIWGTVLATLIGLVMGFCRISRSLFKRLLGRTYVELIRNLPPLVLIFIFYYFISGQIMTALGVEGFVHGLSPAAQRWLSFLFAPPALFTTFFSALITLALFEGAYITEIVRAGIQSIERGQWEASSAFGLSWWQQMRHVILPQAIRRILPPLAGQFISTIKDSAIVSVISIQELTFQGLELMSATYLIFEVWITITVLYLLLTFSLSMAVGRLEIRLRRSEA